MKVTENGFKIIERIRNKTDQGGQYYFDIMLKYNEFCVSYRNEYFYNEEYDNKEQNQYLIINNIR